MVKHCNCCLLRICNIKCTLKGILATQKRWWNVREKRWWFFRHGCARTFSTMNHLHYVHSFILPISFNNSRTLNQSKTRVLHLTMQFCVRYQNTHTNTLMANIKTNINTWRRNIPLNPTKHVWHTHCVY